MPHTHQCQEWIDTITKFKRHKAWTDLTSCSRRFISCFEKNLRHSYDPKARANVVTPFTGAVKECLADRGLSLDKPAASVEIAPNLFRASDASFIFRNELWVIEIKVGLEFNSLGAAVLEASAFRTKECAKKVLLLSLYSKWQRGNLLEVLDVCGMKNVFDQVNVLTSNADKGDAYYENWSRKLNQFIESMPRCT